MAITNLVRHATVQITGTSRVVIFEGHIVDALTLSTASDASTTMIGGDLQPDGPAGWFDIVRASENTSLRFLDDEPDLYGDRDGEPV